MKKKRFLLMAALSFSLATTTAAATLAACKHPTYAQVAENITGTYYVDDDGVEKTIEMGLNSFTLNFGDGAKTGMYSSYEAGILTLIFDGDSEVAVATFNNGILTLNYKGKTYAMYVKSNFTVSFNVDGGSAVESQNVVNGRKATRPENPTKENCVFVGWYKDSAHTVSFDFNTDTIKANTTLYAKFVELNASAGVYKATFDLGKGVDENYPAIETVNRVLYNLPQLSSKDDKAFLGWWVSHYYDRSKLSYKYDGREIYEDVVLYAVWASDSAAVSVTQSGASWTANGTSQSFTVSIKDAAGNELSRETGAITSIAFDFNKAAAGDYSVEVTVNGNTSVAYYKNKALARVTKFTVDGDDFAFLPIETTDPALQVKYYLYLECGGVGHSHVRQELTATGFDFSNCVMKQGGMKFKVGAEANGYTSSLSAEYVLERGLAEVSGLKVDDTKEVVSWDAVENAKVYKLEFTKGANKVTVDVAQTSYDIRSFDPGEWTIKVTPYNQTYNTPATTTLSYTKTRLASPSVVFLNDTIRWNAVEGATSYDVFVNGTAYKSGLTATNVTLAADEFTETGKEYEVTVVANGADAQTSSIASKPVYIHGELTAINYGGGVVSWDAVRGIVKFGVKVGDGEEFFVTDGSNRAQVNFSKSGATAITVTGYAGNNVRQTDKTTTVEVYTVTFETLGGSTVENQYKANGDTLTLPAAPSRLGYTFLGWFNQAENGTKYDGETLTFSSLRSSIYANWEANKYTVTLVVGDGGTMSEETEYEVTFGREFKFPAPNCNDENKEFSGWFTLATGGIRCSDNLGFTPAGWSIAENTVLRAQWGPAAVKYVLLNNGEEYIASKGDGGANLTSVAVRATYKGKPVTAIAENTFQNCSGAKTIRIPSTIKSIAQTQYGLSGNGGAFYGLSNLENVEVYDVFNDRGTREPRNYASVNGCLYTVDSNDALDELYFVPKSKNKEGVFTIADGTQRISDGVLRSFSLMTEVVVPASVVYIGNDAFGSCSKLSKVTFLPAANGALGNALTVKKSFNFCYDLKEITFPKRLASISFDAFDYSKDLKKIFIKELGATKDKTVNYYDVDGVLCKGSELVYYRPVREETIYRIPTGITSIGEKAFAECDNLVTVQFPAMITKIGKESFLNCEKLRTITFDQGENNADLEIGERAFYNCDALENLVLPPNLKTLRKGAFGDNVALTRVTINTNRTAVEYENGAFYGVTTTGALDVSRGYVTEVNLGANVVAFAFGGVFGTKVASITVAQGNPNISSSNGALYNAAGTEILFIPDSMTEFDMDDRMVEIGGGVFQGKTVLSSVKIGKGIRVIGADAFNGCTNLTSVVFKEGGTETLAIGDRAFLGCSNLQTLTFASRNGAAITIGSEAFAKCGNFITELTLPEGVTSIGAYAFKAINWLDTVHLPSTLTEIGRVSVNEEFPSFPVIRYGFDTWDGVKKTVKGIGISPISVFDGCKIETLTVAEGCANFVAIDNVLYEKENGVAKTLLYSGTWNKGAVMPEAPAEGETQEPQYGYLEIPSTVEEVADYAFYQNLYLKKIVFAGTHTSFTFGNWAFLSCQAEFIKIPVGTAELPEGLFGNCSALKTIEVPNTVRTIKRGAFYKCSSLTGLTFATGNDTLDLEIEDGAAVQSDGGLSSMTESSTGAFYGCSKLETIEFPARLKSLGDHSFNPGKEGLASTANKNALKTVKLPATVERIGLSAFVNCAVLESVEFTNGVVREGAVGMTIKEKAFFKSGLLTITLPDTVKIIEQAAFADSKLLSLTIPAGVTTFGSYVGYSALSGYKIGNDKQTIQSITFAYTEQGGVRSCALMELKEKTFADLKNLVTVGGLEYCTNVTVIPTGAFQNTALTAITLPAGVTEIGVSAFDSSKLESIVFPVDAAGKNLVGKIGDYAFRKTALESFTFPTLATGSLMLGKNLFEGCASLTTLRISVSVQDIGASLAKAPNLQTITVDDGSAVNIDDRSHLIFAHEATNNTYTITTAYGAVPLDLNGKFTIPETFKGGSVTAIGENAFAGQNAMRKVVIPASITSIGMKAFSQCRGLETLEFAGESRLMSIGANAFEHTYSMKKVTLPNSVKEIGATCFYISGIKEITMPNELTSLGQKVFMECKRLEKVNNFSRLYAGSSGGNEIAFVGGDMTFYYCTALKEVTFAQNANKLPALAFKYCTALETIDLTGITEFPKYVYQMASGPSTVGSEDVFYGCSSLREVVLDARLTSLPTKTFYQCYALTTIYRSDTPLNERVANKIDISQIKEFATGGTSSTSAYGPFYECKSITEVDLRSVNKLNLTKIFYNCVELQKVTLCGVGVTSLTNEMFNGCVALKTVNYWDGENVVGAENEVTLPDAINFLGTNTFSKTSIEKVTLPASLTVIGTSATASTATVSQTSALFIDCTELREVILPSGLERITADAFKGCINLETIKVRSGSTITGEDGRVTLPTSLNLIGNSAFMNCKKITALDLSNVITFGSGGSTSGTFFGCESLASVTLNSALQVLGSGIFANCTSLTSIDLPASLKATGAYAFMGSGLTSITLPSGVVNLGATTTTGASGMGVFQDCASLVTVVVSSAFKDTGASAFKNCALLQSVTVELDSATNQPKTTALATIGNNAFEGCTALNTIDLSKVTSVGGSAFKNCASLEAVDLSSAKSGTAFGLATSTTSRTNIFEGCTSLKTVTLGSGSTVALVLQKYMFLNCTALESIDLSLAKTLGENMFEGCTALKNVTFGSGLTTIKTNAFLNCTALEEADISKTTTLGTYAFKGCTNLKTVTLCETLTTLDSGVFEGCTLLSTVYKGAPADDAAKAAGLNKADFSGIKTFGATQPIKDCDALVEITLGNTLTTIPNGLFSGLSELQKVNMPTAGLTTISVNAFLNCSSLASLTIPASVTTINGNAFIGTDSLILSVDPASAKFEVDANGWLVNKTDGTVLFVPPYASGNAVTEVNFAAGAKLYGYMFNGYRQVRKVTLPSDLTDVPAYAFWGFKGSFGDDFAIPSSVTSIGNYAFQNCNVPTELTLPSSLTSIGNYAFNGCANLRRIVIPEGVTSIGTNAFQNCTNLTEIYLPSTITSIGNNAFDGCVNLSKIDFPAPVEGAPVTATTGWLTIGNYAFQDCASLNGAIALPDGIKSVGISAFAGCTGIAEISFGKYLQTIGTSAFQDCTSLLAVVFREEGLTSIGISAFEGATSLQTINIPYTVTKIDGNAFYNCTQLRTVSFDAVPEGVTAPALTIAAGSRTYGATSSYVDPLGYGYKGVFVGTAITSIALPDRVTSIGAEAFAGLQIANITLPADLTTIGDYAFIGTPLKSVTIPYKVTSIGNNAFALCAALESLTFQETPEGETPVKLEIANGKVNDYATYSATSTSAAAVVMYDEKTEKYYGGAFVGCAKLGEVTMPARELVVTSTNRHMIGDYAFAFSGITKIDFAGFQRIGVRAFYECEKLAEVVMPEGTLRLETGCFENCTALTQVKVAGTVTYFNSDVFKGCTNMTRVVIPVTVGVNLSPFTDWTAEQTIVIDITDADLLITATWNSNALSSDATIVVEGGIYGTV